MSASLAPMDFHGTWAFVGAGRLSAKDIAGLASAELAGVIVQIEWQEPGGAPGIGERSAAGLRAELAEIRAAGLRVAAWCWLTPGYACAANLAARLEALVPAWADGAPDFLCLDLELDGGWSEGRPADQATMLAGVGAVLTTALPGVPLAVTSHGHAPRLSWSALPVRAVMPQCYDPSKGPAKPGFVGRCLRTWAREFPQARAFPALGVNRTEPARIRALGAEALGRAPGRAPAAIAYWSAIGLRHAGKRAAVRSVARRLAARSPAKVPAS